MKLWEKAKNEFIDIVEWTDDTPNTMVYRFANNDNEIKYGAQLIVRQAQAAVFVNKGKIADIFPSGHYSLETDNMPVMSTLAGWKYGFHSPFKAEVYFVNLKNFTDLKWGTRNPVIVKDPEFGPLRLRAFGSFVVKVADPGQFIQEIVGTDSLFTVEEVAEQLKNLIVSRFSDLLGEKKLPMTELTANYDELSDILSQIISPEFMAYGLSLTKFLVENISLPEAVEQALDKRSSMNVIGNLDNYFKYQSANAMEEAARNPGGDAASGVGMGMGFAMAGQMGKAMATGQQQPFNDTQKASQPADGPPPLPDSHKQTPYFIAINSKKIGPIALSAVLHNIKKGKIGRDTLVWHSGLSNWQKAHTIAALSNSFDLIPPPLDLQGD